MDVTELEADWRLVEEQTTTASVCLLRRSLPFSRLRRDPPFLYILLRLRVSFLHRFVFFLILRNSAVEKEHSACSLTHTDVVSFLTRFEYFWLLLCFQCRSSYHLFSFSHFRWFVFLSLYTCVFHGWRPNSTCAYQEHSTVHFVSQSDKFYMSTFGKGKVTVGDSSRLNAFHIKTRSIYVRYYFHFMTTTWVAISYNYIIYNLSKQIMKGEKHGLNRTNSLQLKAKFLLSYCRYRVL
jgi:hypothetical protein